jgi:hypothetical protein
MFTIMYYYEKKTGQSINNFLWIDRDEFIYIFFR